VRIGKLKGSDQFLINPKYENRENAEYELDLIACGKDGTIAFVNQHDGRSRQEDALATFKIGVLAK
jgi:hypothetical protein